MAERSSFARFNNRYLDEDFVNERIKRNRDMASALLGQNANTVVQSPTQGLAMLARALNARDYNRLAQQEQETLAQQRADEFGRLLQGFDPNTQKVLSGLPSGRVRDAATAFALEQSLTPEPLPKDTRPNMQKEYEFAKTQGYEGSFEDFINLRKASGTTVNVGGEDARFGKLPAGFRWKDPDNKALGVEPIPGGNKDTMSPEAAAKVQLLETALSSAEDFRGYIVNQDGSVNRGNILTLYGNIPFTRGREANVFLLDSIEAKLRAESGAAVPETEVARAGRRFKPHPFDKNSTVKIKSDLLIAFLQGAFNKAQRDGRFDVAGTIDAVEREAEKRLESIEGPVIDTSKIDGFDQKTPEEQQEIIEYLTSVSLGNL